MVCHVLGIEREDGHSWLSEPSSLVGDGVEMRRCLWTILSDLCKSGEQMSWPGARGMTARQMLADEAPGKDGEAYLTALKKHVQHDAEGKWTISGEYAGLSFVAAFFERFGVAIPVFQEDDGGGYTCLSGEAFPVVKEGKIVRVALVMEGAHYDAFIDRALLESPSGSPPAGVALRPFGSRPTARAAELAPDHRQVETLHRSVATKFEVEAKCDRVVNEAEADGVLTTAGGATGRLICGDAATPVFQLVGHVCSGGLLGKSIAENPNDNRCALRTTQTARVRSPPSPDAVAK